MGGKLGPSERVAAADQPQVGSRSGAQDRAGTAAAAAAAATAAATSSRTAAADRASAAPPAVATAFGARLGRGILGGIGRRRGAQAPSRRWEAPCCSTWNDAVGRGPAWVRLSETERY